MTEGGPNEADRVVIISAMSRERWIGLGERMPWSDPAEYQHYLSLVQGAPMLFGRRSYDIFGHDLPGQDRFVLTRDPSRVAPPGVAVSSFAEGLEKAAGRRMFIAGGAGLYRAGLAHADAMYLSEMKGDFDGDTAFPAWGPEWAVAHEVDHPTFVFRVWRRT